MPNDVRFVTPAGHLAGAAGITGMRFTRSGLRTARATRLLAAAALLGTVLAACGDDEVVQPNTLLIPARLVQDGFGGDSALVVVPATARVGVPLTVEVRSWGGGCTERDSTGVIVNGLTADVRPFVREPAPSRNAVCPAILKQFTHTAAVTFARTGSALVRVHGQRDSDGQALTITRAVTVEP